MFSNSFHNHGANLVDQQILKLVQVSMVASELRWPRSFCKSLYRLSRWQCLLQRRPLRRSPKPVLNCHYIEGTTNLLRTITVKLHPSIIICNNQERRLVSKMFQIMAEISECCNFLVCNQDKALSRIRHHFFTIRHHILRQVATVKLHSFYDIQPYRIPLDFFDSDNYNFSIASEMYCRLSLREDTAKQPGAKFSLLCCGKPESQFLSERWRQSVLLLQSRGGYRLD